MLLGKEPQVQTWPVKVAVVAATSVRIKNCTKDAAWQRQKYFYYELRA